MIAGLRAHLVNHRGVFQLLRPFQPLLSGLKHCRRIGHRLIQPEPIERIAQIVMMRDVLFCLPLAVGLQPEPHPLPRAHDAASGICVEHLFVGVNKVKKAHQIGCGPPLIQIRLAKAQITFADKPGEYVIVQQVQFGNRPGLTALGAKHAPILQDEIQPPALHPAGKVKYPREIAGQIRLAKSVCQVHKVLSKACCFTKFMSQHLRDKHLCFGFWQTWCFLESFRSEMFPHAGDDR